MMQYDPKEEALWKIVRPYMDGAQLRKDAPEEVLKANEELRKMYWDLDRGQ